MHIKTIDIHGMRTESEFPEVYSNFLRERGILHTLKRDNAKSEQSARVKAMHRDLIIADAYTEPHHPQQNLAEARTGVTYMGITPNILRLLITRVTG